MTQPTPPPTPAPPPPDALAPVSRYGTSGAGIDMQATREAMKGLRGSTRASAGMGRTAGGGRPIGSPEDIITAASPERAVEALATDTDTVREAAPPEAREGMNKWVQWFWIYRRFSIRRIRAAERHGGIFHRPDPQPAPVARRAAYGTAVTRFFTWCDARRTARAVTRFFTWCDRARARTRADFTDRGGHLHR